MFFLHNKNKDKNSLILRELMALHWRLIFALVEGGLKFPLGNFSGGVKFTCFLWGLPPKWVY
jgi:hypothetical protein